ncbi:hypothetical protein Halha_1667 [Halobacteroides halobius DSM 5150]|uniref:Uncharacterized protein n=1 Tax=Halobacteroides halobius (strain ATCC 35273 / DSM 5150 / MD-1) TaxID=748449 RepID=L0KAN2_HALHC|nr:hypothetical protein [Halobacteroides halobius]AGB41605.1 hypothetical protein Halha_1667 [Halobacteroides halobius DSM 5150]
MAVKDLLANLVTEELIEGYEVKRKEEGLWKEVKCILKNGSSMIINKLNQKQSKEGFQAQFKEHCLATEIRIVAYYTSQGDKIREWVKEVEVKDNSGLVVICLEEAKELEFINKLKTFII